MCGLPHGPLRQTAKTTTRFGSAHSAIQTLIFSVSVILWVVSSRKLDVVTPMLLCGGGHFVVLLRWRTPIADIAGCCCHVARLCRRATMERRIILLMIIQPKAMTQSDFPISSQLLFTLSFSHSKLCVALCVKLVVCGWCVCLCVFVCFKVCSGYRFVKIKSRCTAQGFW